MSTHHPNLEQLFQIIAQLRTPDGCPWDREQTHATLKPYLLEEAYEVLEAIVHELREVVVEELDVHEAGLPREWIRKMRRAMATITPQYNTWRMVQEYARNYYAKG